jgi:hypothetical protein
LSRVETPRPSDATDEQEIVTKHVARVEQILTSERGQWGQLAVEERSEQARP